MAIVLQTRALSYGFPQHSEPLFRDVTMQLYTGDRAALLGANGTGKTTFLHLILGALQPSQGEVHCPHTPW